MSKKCAVILLIVSIIDLGILIGSFLRDIKERAESHNLNEDYFDHTHALIDRKENEHVK